MSLDRTLASNPVPGLARKDLAAVDMAEARAGAPATVKQSRVLIYAMNYTPELIGCGRYTGEIGENLRREGARVDVVTTPPHYPGWAARDGYRAGRYVREDRDGVTIHRCPIGLSKQMKGFGRMWAPLSFALSSAPVVMWRILRDRPTHVFCVEPTLLAAPAAVLAAKCVGARTILHVQDLEFDAAFAVGHVKGGGLKSLVFGFERILLKGFDHVVTISEKMQSRLLEKGVRGERMNIVRNWVDTASIFPLPGANGFRDELGLAADDFVALYAGNIGVKQALGLVMDAAETLIDAPITFVIAGDGPEKAALVARNLPNVKFLPLQPEARLNELLNLADVHVLPQLSGAADLVLPSKLGGILASGKPLLAMADANSEIGIFLADEAVLVPSGDVVAMARHLRAMATKPERQTRAPATSRALKALSKASSMQALNTLLSR